MKEGHRINGGNGKYFKRKNVRKKHIFPIGVQAIFGIAIHKLENHF